MDEKRIEQVLEVEKQAQEIYDAAMRAAQKLPIQAEQEAQDLIEKARAKAQEQARQMIAEASGEADSDHVLAETGEKARHIESLAMKNFDLAVAYVLNRVIGKV